MDDRADSELSFGSAGPSFSIRSMGSASNASITRNSFRAQKLQDFRNKHMQAMQALRRQVTPPVDAQPALLALPMAATNSTHGSLEQPKQLRQFTLNLQAEEELAQDLDSFRQTLATQQRRLESLQEQDTSAQVAEVRKAIEAQACELELLRSQETGIALRGLRENVEICDKMSSQRTQVLHASIDTLKETLRSRHRQIDGFRGLRAGVGALQRAVDEQGQWQPSAQMLRRELIAVQEVLDMQSDALETLAVQLREQHQHDMDSFLSLHEELRVREEQCDTLHAEIEHLRAMEFFRRHS